MHLSLVPEKALHVAAAAATARAGIAATIIQATERMGSWSGTGTALNSAGTKGS